MGRRCPTGTPQGVKDRKLKRSLVDIEGNAARFSSWPDPQGRWGLAEGCETAMATEQLWGFPVWAAISSGNIAKIDPPHWAREAFFFADFDSAGVKAARKARDRQRDNPAILRTRVVHADNPGDDMADVLNSRSK